MLFFSKTIVKISVKVLLFFKNIVYSVLKIVTYPLKLLMQLLKKLFKIPYNFLNKMNIKAKNVVNNCRKLKIKSKSSKKLENKEGF